MGLTSIYHHFMTVFRCSNAPCSTSRTELMRNSGNVDGATVYTSTTGFLKLIFTSDALGTSPGFDAQWSVCTACVAGKYKTSTGPAVCTDCASNTYSAAVVATVANTCTACPLNSGHTLWGQTSITAYVCNTGYTGPAGGPCTLSGWPAGQTGPNARSCALCTAGTYNITTGAANCTN
jgi:hypothetical protein